MLLNCNASKAESKIVTHTSVVLCCVFVFQNRDTTSPFPPNLLPACWSHVLFW